MEHIFSAFGSVSAADQLPGTYLAKLLEEMAESGLNPAEYLEMAGMKSISEQVFWDEVPYRDYLNFVKAVLTADIPALAFRTGLKFSILDQGLVGYAIISSPTLGQAIKALEHYGELLGAGHVIHEHLKLDDKRALYTIECSLSSPALRQFEIEQHSAQFLNSVPLFVVHPGFRFSQINYSFPRPLYAEHIEGLVSCPVLWDQPATELIFDRSWLDTPMSSANDLIADFCQQQCKALMQQVSNDPLLSTKLKNRIRRHPARIPSLSEFASQNNISSRSLHRRLADEGTSYQEIVHSMRMSLAEQFLKQTDRSIKDICFQLGYTEVPNFQRAFRLWSGTTPARYRKQIKLTLPQAS